MEVTDPDEHAIAWSTPGGGKRWEYWNISKRNKNGREIKVSKTMWFPSLENINDPIPLFRRLRHEEVSALFKAKIFSFLLGTRQRGLLVTAVPKSEPPSWTSWSGDKEIYFLSMIFLLYLQHRYVRLSSLHRRRSDLPCKVLCTARPGRRSVYLHLAAHWQSRSTLHLLLWLFLSLSSSSLSSAAKQKHSPPRLTPAPGIPWSTQLSMQPSEKLLGFCISSVWAVCTKRSSGQTKLFISSFILKKICSHQNVSPHRFYLTIMILLWCSIPKGKDHLQIKTFNFKTVQCWVLTPILSSTGPNVRFCPTSEVISALILNKNVKIWTKL